MKIDTSEFQEEFSRRFDSFISSSPLDLVYDTSTLGVDLHVKSSVDGKTSFFTLEYLFDFDESVKLNIFKIKEDLITNHYPVLSREVIINEEVSAKEKADLLKSGKITALEAVDYEKEVSTLEEYTVVRVLSEQNLIHILDKSGNLFACTFEMPLYFFRRYLTPDLPKAQELFRSSVDSIKPITTKRGA